MKTSILNIILYAALLTSSIVLSQEIEENKKIDSIIPYSIYSFKSTTTINFKNKFNLNNKLNLKQYSFLHLNKRNIENDNYTLPISLSGGKPSSLIYDTYNEIYHKMNLESNFFKVSELYNLVPRNRK